MYYKKTKKNRKCHDDNPSFWRSNPKDKFFLNEKLVGGDVVFHQFYEETYMFLFVDKNVPYFADTKGGIGIINNPHFSESNRKRNKNFLELSKRKRFFLPK